MTRIDANGNTVAGQPCYLRNLLKRVGTSYETDAHDRIMVNLPDGGYVCFFAKDETRLARWVRENIKGKLPANPWVLFTKRTEDPKLAWLEVQLTAAGIESRREGHSAHAPILQVHQSDLDAAWKILDPVDELPDDDAMFQP